MFINHYDWDKSFIKNKKGVFKEEDIVLHFGKICSISNIQQTTKR